MKTKHFFLFAFMFVFGMYSQVFGYVYLHDEKKVFYPGDPIKLIVSANGEFQLPDIRPSPGKEKTMSDFFKADSNKILLELYNINLDELSKFKEIIKTRQPFKKLKISFKHSGQAYYDYCDFNMYVGINYRYCIIDITNTIKLPPLPPGIYAVKIKFRNYTGETVFFVSSITAISKVSPDKLLVYVVDFKSGKPVANVNVKVTGKYTDISLKGISGSDGIVLFDFVKSNVNISECQSLKIQADIGKSIALIDTQVFGKLKEKIDYIYTDRMIYRPGQKVFIKGFSRLYDGSQYSIPASEEKTIIIGNRQQGKFTEQKVKTDEFGSFSTTFDIPSAAPLGNYWVYLQDSRQYCDFDVSEYRKPEIEISMKTSKNYYLNAKKAGVKVKAQYYFGEPVKNCPFTYYVYKSCYYNWSYRFIVDGIYDGDEDYKGTGITDDKGRAEITIPLKPSDEDAYYQVKVVMKDSSNREVRGFTTLCNYSRQFSLRIDTDRTFYYDGKKVFFSIKALDNIDMSVKTSVTMKIFKVVGEVYNRRYIWVATKKLTTNQKGLAVYSFSPGESACYVAKVFAVDKFGHQISELRDFYYIGKDNSKIDYCDYYNSIIPNKQEYQPGETAELLFITPEKNVNLWITAEGKSVFFSKAVKTQGNAHVVTFPVKEEYAPGFLIKFVYFYGGEWFGRACLLNISGSKNNLKLDVFPEKNTYKPGETIFCKIRTMDGSGKPVMSQVTLGIVDESVFQLASSIKNSITSVFAGRINNMVNTGSSLGGRDGCYGDEILSNSFGDPSYVKIKTVKKYTVNSVAKRCVDTVGRDSIRSDPTLTGGNPKIYQHIKDKPLVQPAIRSFFPDSCYFNPNIITDQNGEARISFVLPDTLTTWRATAKGITKDTKVGETISKFTVSKNLLVRLIAPRFIRQYDNLVVSGIVHNCLKTEKNVDLMLEASGAEIISPVNNRAVVKPGQSMKVEWVVKASDPGNAVFTLKGLTDEESDAMKLELPVKVHGLETAFALSGETDDARELTVSLPECSNPKYAKIKINISSSIAYSLIPALRYLADYPYGCTEQTMNRFMPTVVVARSLKDFNLYDDELEKKLPIMLNQGIERLKKLRHSDGGWGWWENDESDPELTALVVYGLSLASCYVEFDFTDELDGGISWLIKNYNSQTDPCKKTAMLYALTFAGKGNAKWADGLFAARNKLDVYSKLKLAQILHKLGKNSQAVVILDIIEKKAHVSDRYAYWQSGADSYGWRDNTIEITALALRTFLMIKPDHPFCGKIVRYLVDNKQSDGWDSTKDTAEVVLALNEFLRKTNELTSAFSGSVDVNGAEIARFNAKSNGEENNTEILVPSNLLKIGKNKITIRKTGKGKLYYTMPVSFYDGSEHLKSLSGGVSVKREYFLVNSKIKPGSKGWITPLKGPTAKLKTGDMVIVRITIYSGKNYQYMMLEDPKPAGFEKTEDPFNGNYNLKSSFISDLYYFRPEFRDDRTLFFMNYFNRGTYKFSYTLIAETPGRIHALPANASLMYIRGIRGNSDSMVFDVSDQQGKTLQTKLREIRQANYYDSSFIASVKKMLENHKSKRRT